MSESMMTCAECDELFLDYFEAELEDAAAKQVEAHVSSCARCQGLVRDINGIRNTAAAMPDLTPSRDLWSGIEARIQPSVRSIAPARPASIAMSRGWLAAAAAALIVVSSSVTYVAATKTSAPKKQAASTMQSPVRVAGAVVEAEGQSEVVASQPSVAPTAPKTSVSRNVAPVVRAQRPAGATLASARPGDTRWSAPELALSGEIDRLQVMLEKKRTELEPETIRVVEENLAIIDAAVKQARAAVERDPASGFLNERLDNALQKKAQLLRTVVFLPSST